MGGTNLPISTDKHADLGKRDMYDDDSSSSGDEDDDDEEDEGLSNNGKVREGTTANTPDGKSTALDIPLRYTKSGRKRSIPFPVRVSA